MKLNSFSFIYILMSRRDIVWQCTYACQQNVKKLRHQICKLWQYGLWSFQTGVTKLERFLPKNQHTQRKLLNFENWGLKLKEISSRFEWQSQNWCTLVGKYGILTKNVNKRVKYRRKLVKKLSKNTFFVKLTYLQRAGTHSDPPIWIGIKKSNVFWQLFH